MKRLEHKTAVVTGASSGIGRAIALAYAGEGADVVVNYRRSRQRAEALVEEIKALGVRAFAIQADVANKQDIDKLIVESMKALGRIDIWVNNAGADILTGDGAELDLHAKLEQLIEVDLKGTIHACWAIAPLMKQAGRGVIINTSWDLAIHGFEGSNPQIFAATKAGILGFSRSFALSAAPEVRVNTLAPGWIHTAFAEQDMENDYFKARISEIPLQRFGKPEDVAEAAVYLASDDAVYVTGEVLNINGGLI